MQHNTLRVTRAQEQTLEYLKKLFGERGYLIHPVADFFKESEWDFLALPKESPRTFVRVRPIESGKVMLQSFGARTQYAELKNFLEKRKEDLAAPIRWAGSQLPFAQERPDWWDQYLTPQSQDELRALRII